MGISDRSHAALLWVLEGAQAEGMGFDPAKMADFAAGVALEAPVDNQTAVPGVLMRLLRGRGTDRDPPPSLAAISVPAREKWRRPGDRPVPLRPFGPRLAPPGWPGGGGSPQKGRRLGGAPGGRGPGGHRVAGQDDGG